MKDVATLSGGPKKPKEEKPKKLLRRKSSVSVDPESVSVTRKSIPLWESKWTTEQLQDRRSKMGSREFDRGYRQVAVSDDDLVFKMESIEQCLERDVVLPDKLYKGSMWENMIRDGGVDLAIATANKELAYFVILGIATDRKTHDRWIIQMERSRGLTFSQQIDAIRAAYYRFGYEIIEVENNGYQNAVVRHFSEEEQQLIPVRGFHTGEVQKKDLELGVPSLAVEFEHHRWHIPYGDVNTRRRMEPLLEELYSYPSPGVHDDCLMALYFAREARRNAVSQNVNVHMVRF